MHIPKAPGFSSMLKDGAKYFSGVEEAVIRNIQACKAFTSTLRTTYGPRGMNKMVINHLSKLFVTNDAATIIKELEVEHPAVKLIVLASQMQEAEIGDGTNYVVIFAGSLLGEAEDLIRMGLTPIEVIEGYELALEKALEILPTLTVDKIEDCRNHDQIIKGIKTSIMSKQYGNEDFLSELITKACVSILPNEATFNVDNIRVCKILGSGLLSSTVIQGMVFKRTIQCDIIKATDAKLAVYTCAIESMQTETKGTVLIKSAKELSDFSKGEEDLIESQIKAIADAGVKVIVSGGKVSDLALHYINKYNIMAVRLNSKWDIRRVCRTVGATALPKLVTPSSADLGFCDDVYVDEIGDNAVVVFKQNAKESNVATILIRGSTNNMMDDIERAIDDGVNNFKAINKDGRLLPGAGATEIELAQQISNMADKCPGLEQYAVKKFSKALAQFPKILADTAGVSGTELISKLYAEHQKGHKNVGFDIKGPGVCTLDAAEAGILDLHLTKHWAMKYAVSAACTILRVDQIIMAKRAGGPKPKDNPDWDED